MTLEAARKEALEVKLVLEKYDVKTELFVGAPEEGTGAGVLPDVPPADYFAIVDLLLAGEFDIVHYSGHATFDPQAPDRTGWVFKEGILTAHELEGMERPPQLVVANACLSSQVSQQASQPSAARESTAQNVTRGDSSLVASLADEFFKQGVSDYIGVAWEIPSDPAQVFAIEFYKALLQPGGKIGPALQRTRTELYDKREVFGAAWAAYQHYGDPTRSVSSGSK
jgi:CHAT domain-containing protein